MTLYHESKGRKHYELWWPLRYQHKTRANRVINRKSYIYYLFEANYILYLITQRDCNNEKFCYIKPRVLANYNSFLLQTTT